MVPYKIHDVVTTSFLTACRYAAQDHLHRVEMERWLHAPHGKFAGGNE